MTEAINWIQQYWWVSLFLFPIVTKILNRITRHWSKGGRVVKVILIIIDILDVLKVTCTECRKPGGKK